MWGHPFGLVSSKGKAVKIIDEILKKHGIKIYIPYHVGGCGKGWADIVDRLCQDLIKMGWDKDLRQIKEKFGGLRFYIGEGTKEMHERIGKARDESYLTCETCGKEGKQSPRNNSEPFCWQLTLCDECHKLRLKHKDNPQKFWEEFEADDG